MTFLTPLSLDAFGAVILLGLLGMGMLLPVLLKYFIKEIFYLLEESE